MNILAKQAGVRSWNIESASEIALLLTVGGHVECVRILLEHGASATLANALGESALHVAAWDGHAEVVSLLLGSGASPSKRGPEGETPLLLAADGGHLEVHMHPSTQRIWL